ncbi:MAG TPA: hypothetical protein VMV86_04925, partial [Methanosarcinales archaeon]|nr:hypothetical protein [Methanosarcinales archaeon]
MFNKKRVVLFVVWLIIISLMTSTILAIVVSADTTTQPINNADAKTVQEEDLRTITISAAGDVTMGR